LVEPGPVPLLRMRVGGRVALHGRRRDLADPLEHRLLLILVLEALATETVGDLALAVHHVVGLQQVPSDLAVSRPRALLRRVARPRDEFVLDGLALLHPEPLHDALDALGAEDAQEVVLEREIEARRAWIALAARAAPELVVDAARLVALGADDVQP